ncbi:MAG TPA: DoxX family protein [Methylocella sp.]|nr:DoxX family protein [Methylocella sp.]
MTRIPISRAGKPSGLAGVLLAFYALLDGIPQSLISLGGRIFPAAVFWRSGQTKVEGWHVTDNAIALFRDEYALPLLDPELAAKIAAFSEHFFPVLLVIGLASRFAALALLCMTAVIEIFVYPDAWPEHGVWATCFLVVIARGPGIFSLDHLLAKRWSRSGA